jgi:basic membrane lipoprotein Med (substrate-binding protein (PBP1-ABC) superfamily)
MSTDQAITMMAQAKSRMLQMYGVEAIGVWHDQASEWHDGDDKMLLMSMLSDVQEMIERGMNEEARLTLNRAKWLAREHL